MNPRINEALSTLESDSFVIPIIRSIISYMETLKWEPSEEEREVMEAVWILIKGSYEKLKEETNAQDDYIRKMLQEMSDRYYS